jgi:hypothetical protein
VSADVRSVGVRRGARECQAHPATDTPICVVPSSAGRCRSWLAGHEFTWRSRFSPLSIGSAPTRRRGDVPIGAPCQVRFPGSSTNAKLSIATI